MSVKHAVGARAHYEHSGFFVLRTPLLPFEVLRGWTDGLELAHAFNSPNPELALNTTVKALQERLAQIYSSPVLQEALFVASKSLADSYRFWIDAPTSDRGQRVQQSLVRYLARMAARSTPFGLCAGVTVGRIADHCALRLAPVQQYRRKVRLDITTVSSIASAIEQCDDMRHRVVYRPNSSLYRVGEQFRYVESRRRSEHAYHLTALTASRELVLVIERAARGATLGELARVLRDQDSEIEIEEVQEYLRALVDNQVLTSTLQPAITGEEPLAGLINEVSALGHAPVADRLRELAGQLEKLSEVSTGAGRVAYEAVSDVVRPWLHPPESEASFHVDLMKPAADAAIPERVIGELMEGVEQLRRFAAPSVTRRLLSEFKSDFARRYAEQEVQLVEALDADHGIGFGNTARDQLVTELVPEPVPGEGSAAWSPRDSYLIEKLQTLAPGCQAVDISDARFDPGEPCELPEAMQLSFRVLAASHDDWRAGRFALFLEAVGGPSGVNILGRFCHADSSLAAHVRAHLRREEQREPDAVYAEVVYYPSGRAGNVVARPALRNYEVVYLGRSGLPSAQQIDISDLMISVRDNRIILRSRRLNCHVRTRLTTAHNYIRRGPPLYRFLCALQHEHSANLAFYWGRLGGLPFLPRVVAGRCILASAQWTLKGIDLSLAGGMSAMQSLSAFARLRRQIHLPRYFCVVEGDSSLAVDAENALLVQAFLELVKGRSVVKLEEMLPGPDQLIAEGPTGHYVHEITLPVVSTAPAADTRPQGVTQTTLLSASPVCVRRCAPGAAWIHVNLYCGYAEADRLLRESVPSLIREELGSCAPDSWFFVRYGDPDWHIRLRMHANARETRLRVFARLTEWSARLLEAGTLWRVQFDTYVREVERYGGCEGIAVAESLFCADSDAVLDIAGCAFNSWYWQERRWLLALVGVDSLLNDFDVDIRARATFARALTEALRAQLGVGVLGRREIGAKYRSERHHIERCLRRDGSAEDEHLQAVLTAFHKRSCRVRPLISALRQLAARERLTERLPKLLASFAHMHVNRMLRRNARHYELIVYEFLSRFYASQVARGASAEHARVGPGLES